MRPSEQASLDYHRESLQKYLIELQGHFETIYCRCAIWPSSKSSLSGVKLLVGILGISSAFSPNQANQTLKLSSSEDENSTYKVRRNACRRETILCRSVGAYELLCTKSMKNMNFCFGAIPVKYTSTISASANAVRTSQSIQSNWKALTRLAQL